MCTQWVSSDIAVDKFSKRVQKIVQVKKIAGTCDLIYDDINRWVLC